ncbi:hypothetical protein MLD38_009230 [Melastoma candidum]|uniref:Uncharacterized protein n=1 Tax=Melastoma candidum TaxID=119954 RepID=A0ACB9S182_9MYRT|nr:hypothetical protein MLD38_009230 [Melastoma candidum]
MSNQLPPPSRPWLRLTSLTRPNEPPATTLAAQPTTTTTTPTATTPVPPPAGSPPLRPAVTLPIFVRPPVLEPTPRPLPPVLAPLTTPVATPTPEPQPLPRVLVSQQPAPPPSASITPPPPAPIVEPSAPLSSTTAVPPTANSASVPTTPILKPVAPSASLLASPSKKLSPLPEPPRTVAPTSSLTASPAKKLLPRPSPTVSPPKTKLSSPAPAPSSVAALISDTKPPRIIKPKAETPPRSPALKPVAPPPPSPLKLPPPQIKAPDEDVTPKIPLEAEQKSVLFQKSVAAPQRENGNGDTIRSVGGQKPGIAAATVKEANDVAASTGTGNGIIAKKKVESGKAGVKVIMMAGENKGATMELTHPAKNRSYKIGNKDSSSSSDEGKHGREHKGHKGKAPTTASLPMATYTNSNVQGVINSILYNSSCTNRDPGVHFSLTRKPAEGAFPHMKENKD